MDTWLIMLLVLSVPEEFKSIKVLSILNFILTHKLYKVLFVINVEGVIW